MRGRSRAVLALAWALLVGAVLLGTHGSAVALSPNAIDAGTAQTGATVGSDGPIDRGSAKSLTLSWYRDDGDSNGPYPVPPSEYPGDESGISMFTNAEGDGHLRVDNSTARNPAGNWDMVVLHVETGNLQELSPPSGGGEKGLVTSQFVENENWNLDVSQVNGDKTLDIAANQRGYEEPPVPAETNATVPPVMVFADTEVVERDYTVGGAPDTGVYVWIDPNRATLTDGDGSAASFETGEEYRGTFEIGGSTETTTFELVEGTGSFDESYSPTGRADSEVSGTATLAAGTEMLLEIRLEDGSVQRKTVDLEGNALLGGDMPGTVPAGTVTTAFNLTGHEDQDFTAGLYGPGAVRDDDEYLSASNRVLVAESSGTVGEAVTRPHANISMGNQTGEGDVIVVDSVRLSDGGFVSVHTGSPDGPTVAHSGYLEAAAHEDLAITLDEAIDETRRVWAVVHRDSDSDRTFDYPDSDAAYANPDGSAVFASAEYTLEATPTDVRTTEPPTPTSRSTTVSPPTTDPPATASPAAADPSTTGSATPSSAPTNTDSGGTDDSSGTDDNGLPLPLALGGVVLVGSLAAGALWWRTASEDGGPDGSGEPGSGAGGDDGTGPGAGEGDSTQESTSAVVSAEPSEDGQEGERGPSGGTGPPDESGALWQSVPQTVPRAPALHLEYDDIQKGPAIGAGGNADVYRATVETGDGPVDLAVKEPRVSGTFHTETVERMSTEAETWEKLDDHDYVVGVVDHGVEPIPWIAMEYMDGGHLGERSGGLGLDQSLWTAIAITEGVAHAHHRGVAHLDLKPSNVLFREIEGAWDVPKIADWGLAKLLLDHSKSVEGYSPQYAAPEQFDEAFGEADHRTDVYQLGAVCYELFVGRPPFEGGTGRVINSVLSDEPAPPSTLADVPPELDDVLLRALAKEKTDRYESVLYLRDELQALFDRDTG